MTTFISKGRVHEFRIALEVSAALDMPASELGSLLLDGIFALDEHGLLFPGVTWPPIEDRLLMGSVEVDRTARPAAMPATSAVYRHLMGKTPRRTPPLLADITDDLDHAVSEVEAASLVLRSFIGQLRGFAMAARSADPTDLNREKAAATMEAANALVRHIEEELRSAM